MNAVQEKAEAMIAGRILYYNNNSSYFHFHDKFEVLKVITNSCGFLIDGNYIIANKGDIVFLDENVFHQFIGKAPTQMKMIQFPADIITDRSTPFAPVKVHITHQEIQKIPKLEESIDFLIDTILETDGGKINPYNNPYIKNITEAFYHLLAKHFPGNEFTAGKERLNLRKIINYIKDHYTEDITVSSIAEKMYMSRTNLSSFFSKYTGTSINSYTNSLRVKHANNLLLQGKTITEASLESGFKSIRTFNHVYKKYMGVTPSEYLIKLENKT